MNLGCFTVTHPGGTSQVRSAQPEEVEGALYAVPAQSPITY